MDEAIKKKTLALKDLPLCHSHESAHSNNRDQVVDYNLMFPPLCQHLCLAEHRVTGIEFDSKIRSRTNICVTICVLVCCLMCLLLVFNALSTMAVLEARLAYVEDKLAVCTSKQESGALSRQQNIHEGSTEENQMTEPFRRQRRNAAGSSASYVHLVGRGHNDFTTQVSNITFFKWSRREQHRNVHGLSLLPNSQDIYRIKVSNIGVYLVYCQVGLHGRGHLDAHYYCSHRTIHRRQNGPWTTLLSSVLTQDNLGRDYQHLFPDENFKPLDSQLHMGVFHLLPNDELAVQLPPHCSNTDYSITSDNAYFGVIKLG